MLVCLVRMVRRQQRTPIRPMAARYFVLVEHYFLGDIGRPLVPLRILPVQGYSQNGSRTHVRTAPPQACTTQKFKADMKISVLHGASDDLDFV